MANIENNGFIILENILSNVKYYNVSHENSFYHWGSLRMIHQIYSYPSKYRFTRANIPWFWWRRQTIHDANVDLAMDTGSEGMRSFILCVFKFRISQNSVPSPFAYVARHARDIICNGHCIHLILVMIMASISRDNKIYFEIYYFLGPKRKPRWQLQRFPKWCKTTMYQEHSKWKEEVER